MEVSQQKSKSNIQENLLEHKESSDEDENDQSQKMSNLRIDRINSAPQQTQLDLLESEEVKVVLIDDHPQESSPTNGSSHHSHAKRHTDGLRGKHFQSCNPGRQFRSILKSNKSHNDDSLLVSRVDASGNEIKAKRKGHKPSHKITFHQQIQEVNVVENWKQYNTDVSSDPGCGCNLI